MLSRYRLIFAGVLLVVAAPTGCSTDRQPYVAHSLFVHPDGYALDQRDFEWQRTKDLKRELDQTVLKGIQQHADRLKKAGGPPAPGPAGQDGCDGTLRLLIFVHGGLNTRSATIGRMEELLSKNGEAPFTCYYPIFINWQSGLLSAMKDDLFRIRFGHPSYWVGIPTSLVVIPARLVASIANLPMAFAHSLDNMAETLIGAREQGDPAYCVAGDFLFYLGPQVASLATVPLVEGFGRPAWDIMKRRAQLAVTSQLVDGPDELEYYAKTTKEVFSGEAAQGQTEPREDLSYLNEGAIRTLAWKLRERIKFDGKRWYWIDQPPAETPTQATKQKAGQMPAKTDVPIDYARAVPVEITLVGHSMGAILLNRLLGVLDNYEEKAAQGEQPLPVRRIIYMAPAASVNELEDFLVPYLHYNTQAQFWLFLLNRRDESREIPLNGWALIVPRGSLLSWIDTYLESETSIGQATSGRMRNLRDFYQLDPSPKRRGTRSCVTPSWPAKAGPPPEELPIKEQYRKLLAHAPAATFALQHEGRFRVYESPARINDDTTPSEHGDFGQPHFFLEVLCHADGEAFRDKSICSSTPYWLDGDAPQMKVPLFGREVLSP
jgi:pimeloyl-ACP methyl ester carboxylesterase